MEFVKMATRPSSVCRETYVIFFMTDHGLKKFYSIPLDEEKSGYYVEKESHIKMLKNVLEEVMKNPEKNISDYQACVETLVEKAKKVYENINSPPEKLWKAYEDYSNFKIKFSLYLMATFSAEEFIVPKIAKIFPDKLYLISSPGKPFIHHKMAKDLLTKSSKEMQKEYGWMNCYNYQEEDYPISYFEELKKTISKESVKKMFEETEKNQREFDEFIKTVKNPELKKECILLHEYAFIKTDRVDYWKKAMCYVREFFRKLAVMSDSTLKETTNLTPNEIEELLFRNKFPNREQMVLRGKKQFFIEIIGRNIRVITDKSEMQKIREEVEEHISEVKEFKGITASPGYGKGTARIITDKTQLKKMKDGDVIVTIWTTTDYLPIMKKASAIVAEEGGMTSHAAVTSRELKKPCVIGTKIATKVLKDGDLVEVDADKGIVRKI